MLEMTLDHEVESPTTETTRWLSFDIAGQCYAVSIHRVQEVIRPSEVTPVPAAPNDVLGIINLRGTIVTVLDGHRRLGLSDVHSPIPLHTDTARIIVFDVGAEPVGLWVDAINDVIEFMSNELSPPPTGRVMRPEDPITGVVRRGESFVALADAFRLCHITTQTTAALELHE